MEKDTIYFGVKEIARRANVSIATVDRVIHNRPGVSEKTKKKINDIIRELDYQPNILASRLASKKSIILAVLIPRASEETNFWTAPLKGIQKAENEIKAYGIQLLYFFFDLSDESSFIEQAELIQQKGVHGVVISPSFIEPAKNFAMDCQAAKIPYIFIDSNIPDQQSLAYIGPHLFKSGYVSAKLLTYRRQQNSKTLVINISKEIENYNYLQIEEGFRAYFTDHGLRGEIIRMDINETDSNSVARQMAAVFEKHNDIESIFVTNSRVSTVADYLLKHHLKNVSLVGYDFIQENITYLNEGVIDFLICHKPEEQGYRSAMTLYQKLVLGNNIEKIQYMPIDIVTRENQEFYQN